MRTRINCWTDSGWSDSHAHARSMCLKHLLRARKGPDMKGFVGRKEREKIITEPSALVKSEHISRNITCKPSPCNLCWRGFCLELEEPLLEARACPKTKPTLGWPPEHARGHRSERRVCNQMNGDTALVHVHLRIDKMIFPFAFFGLFGLQKMGIFTT